MSPVIRWPRLQVTPSACPWILPPHTGGLVATGLGAQLADRALVADGDLVHQVLPGPFEVAQSFVPESAHGGHLILGDSQVDAMLAAHAAAPLVVGISATDAIADASQMHPLAQSQP